MEETMQNQDIHNEHGWDWDQPCECSWVMRTMSSLDNNQSIDDIFCNDKCFICIHQFNDTSQLGNNGPVLSTNMKGAFPGCGLGCFIHRSSLTQISKPKWKTSKGRDTPTKKDIVKFQTTNFTFVSIAFPKDFLFCVWTTATTKEWHWLKQSRKMNLNSQNDKLPELTEHCDLIHCWLQDSHKKQTETKIVHSQFPVEDSQHQCSNTLLQTGTHLSGISQRHSFCSCEDDNCTADCLSGTEWIHWLRRYQT